MCGLHMQQSRTHTVPFPSTTQQKDKALRVLIIDDEELFCRSLTAILEDLDCAVLSAHTATQGLARLQRDQEIDLVLIDVRLSNTAETEGLSLLEKSRALRPHTPVIVMSAFGTQEMKEKADRLGARAFLDKPFRVERLLYFMREANGKPIASE